MSDSRVTRRDEERVKHWTPPSKALQPIPIDGIRYRWVREATNADNDDRTNVESKMSEGYTPVRSDDPGVAHLRNLDKAGDGTVRRKGLVLMKIEDHLAEERNNHYHRKAQLQQQTVNETALESMRRTPGAHNPEAEVTRSVSKPKVPTARATSE